MNQITISGWLATGWQVSLTLDETADAATIGAILSKIDMVARAGVLPTSPQLAEGQSKEVIGTVVKRMASDGKTPIVDLYPAWSKNNLYGAFKHAHFYLNTPADVWQFEAQSGLTVALLPLCESQTPMQRKADKPTRFEVNVIHPFEVVKTLEGEHQGGMPAYSYRYFAPMVKGKEVKEVKRGEGVERGKEVKRVEVGEMKQPTSVQMMVAEAMPAGMLKADGSVNQAWFWKQVVADGFLTNQICKWMGISSIGAVPPQDLWESYCVVREKRQQERMEIGEN